VPTSRRCRVCNRPLTSPQWRKVGLGPVCARRLGLRLIRTVSVVPVAGSVRRFEPDDDQLLLFDLEGSEG
jgi:hypothetical protein